MIYIDENNKISTCLICKSNQKIRCNCQDLSVFVHEGMLFWIKYNQQILPDTQEFKEYQEKKAFLLPKIKNAYPNAKTISLYPYKK